MDVMGAALEIGRADMLRLGTNEAELCAHEAGALIDQICDVASSLTAMATSLFPDQITPDTLRLIQGRINDNIGQLR